MVLSTNARIKMTLLTTSDGVCVMAEKRTMTQLAILPPCVKVTEASGMVAKVVVEFEAVSKAEARYLSFVGLHEPLAGAAGAVAGINPASNNRAARYECSGDLAEHEHRRHPLGFEESAAYTASIGVYRPRRNGVTTSFTSRTRAAERWRGQPDRVSSSARCTMASSGATS